MAHAFFIPRKSVVDGQKLSGTLVISDHLSMNPVWEEGAPLQMPATGCPFLKEANKPGQSSVALSVSDPPLDPESSSARVHTDLLSLGRI